VWPGSPVEFDPGFGPESPDLVTSRALTDFFAAFSL
jgi:hypothetical protein